MTLAAIRFRLPAAACCCLMLLAPDEQPQTESDPDTQTQRTDRESIVSELKTFSVLVGEWRGVGQPRRGSSAGAWSEKAACQWSFDDSSPVLVLQSESGQQYRTLRLGWDAERRSAIADVSLPDSEERIRYFASDDAPNDSATILVDATEADDVRRRITVRQINDIRVTLLFEERRTARGSWRRLSEIGYTRAGRKLAKAGAGAPECVVTGGLGTVPVMHQGKTWYVCCDGCRQAFEADPEGTIAAWRERQQKRDDR